jgi:hypothetical protein
MASLWEDESETRVALSTLFVHRVITSKGYKQTAVDATINIFD